jgi:hypothetical protein
MQISILLQQIRKREELPKWKQKDKKKKRRRNKERSNNQRDEGGRRMNTQPKKLF